MISDTIFLELDFFIKSFIMGIILLFFYDVIRASRRVIHQPDGIVGLFDVLYWCVAGALLFLLSMDENDGLIRFYALLATGLGMLLYNRTVSKLILKLFCIIGNFCKKMAKKLFFIKKSLKKTTKEVKM